MAYTPERNQIFETVRYAAEVTPGTAVTVDHNLQSINVQPSNKTSISKFRPAGSKVDTVLALGREWTEFKIDCKPTYEEILMVFDSLIAKNTGGVITMKTTEPNTPATYSFEVGTGSNAVKFASGIIASADLKWTPDELTLTGDGFGQKMTSCTATAVAGTPAITPIQAGQVTIKVDGVTLTRCFEAELNVGRNWQMVNPINANGTGFTAISELAPEMTFSVTVEADAQGMGFLDTLRNDNATRLFEIEATDGVNTFTVELGGKVSETKDYGTVDGVTTVGFVFSVVMEDTLSSPIRVTVSQVAP